MLMAASALSVPALDERTLLGLSGLLGGLAASRQRREREAQARLFRSLIDSDMS